MYLLRLLGPPSLEGPHGRVAGRVTQERKLAVLAVLARAEGRTLTRDFLAAMFWPESDQARARHNVADAVWVMRSALGEGAIHSQGNRLTLNPEVVATDVDALEEALREGSLHRAADLYTGAFMEGFHISGAAEFEHWLDRERSRLLAAHAARLEALIREAVRAGGATEAVSWAMRLAAADPLNSRLAVLCMDVLTASGDSAGAIREGERHGRLLDEELDILAPREIAERIQELRHSPPPIPSAGGEVATPGVERSAGVARVPVPATPRGAGASGRPARVQPPPLRPARATTLSVVAVAAVIVILLAWVAPRVVSEPAAPPVADRILVVPFENRTGDPELDLLGQLAADVVIRALSRAGVGDVVLPMELVATGETPAAAPRGPRQARGLARRHLAGIWVSGTVDRHAGGAELSATIGTATGSRVAAVLDPYPVDPRRSAPALERLGSRVVGTLAAHLGQELPEHPFVVPTPSYESYRTADRATSLFLDRRYDSAAATYRRAYQLDTTALGYLLWEGISHWNLARYSRVWEILEELRPRRDELTPFDAVQFDWLEAVVLGDRAGALRAARTAHALHPHSGVGGYQLGRELGLSGYYEEAVEVFRRLDPDRGWLARWVHYWTNLTGAYHVLGRHEEELATADDGYRRHPEPALLAARVRALSALGRIDELYEALRQSTTPEAHVVAARTLHIHGRASLAVAVAERGLRMLAVAPLPPGASSAEHTARRNQEARLLILAGRLEEARSVLHDLLLEDPMGRDLLGWAGFVEARLGLADEARSRIAALEVLGREPFATGGPTVARAAIHAELGDDPALVRLLLEQAHQEGWRLSFFHFTILFESVRDHPEVRDFFAPMAPVRGGEDVAPLSTRP
jgi:DNA-binding SARP family transcriptional activator/tetratricopeptide (TPR) repeat protein